MMSDKSAKSRKVSCADTRVSGPSANGLHDPSFERDGCGFGLIANLDDSPSHWVIETAISALARLTHRGAVAADGKTGDGCGLLIKFPEKFLRAVGEESGLELNGDFAAGTVFWRRIRGSRQRSNAKSIGLSRRQVLRQPGGARCLSTRLFAASRHCGRCPESSRYS